MERSAGAVEAQENYGQRAIIRTRCRHRLPCSDAAAMDGRRVHIDGLTFVDEAAAQRFDRTQLLPARGSWQRFTSWEAARARLRDIVAAHLEG